MFIVWCLSHPWGEEPGLFGSPHIFAIPNTESINIRDLIHSHEINKCAKLLQMKNDCIYELQPHYTTAIKGELFACIKFEDSSIRDIEY